MLEAENMLCYNEKIIEKIHSLGSRKTVGYILGKLQESNNYIIAAYADVGRRFGFSGKMEDGCLQAGIAESSLVGIISGLYHEGLTPYGIAYAPFLTMRAADQIRMSVGEMGLGIKLIGGSAGLVSGHLGAASMALDDLALMRGIPNLIILSPADCLEEAKILEAAAAADVPIYIRLTGGDKIIPIYHRDYTYKIGSANIVADFGKDVVIYATGVLVSNALSAAEALRKENIYCTVIDMHTIKPIDKQIIEQFQDIPLAVSLEEHNIIGGLGSAIAEELVTLENHTQTLKRLGVENFYPAADSYEQLLKKCGLTQRQIMKRIKEMLL